MPRVVTSDELCQEPNGAIFSAYEPCIVAGLFRRGRVLRHGDGLTPDFFYHTLLASPGLSGPIPVDDKQQAFSSINDGERWGCWDPEELFVLYSPDDLAAMVQVLIGDAVV